MRHRSDSSMRAVLSLSGILLLTGCARILGATAVRAEASARTTFHELEAAGDRRGFLLHQPQSQHGPMPLLIALHGSSANANTVMDESGLNEIADRVGA